MTREDLALIAAAFNAEHSVTDVANRLAGLLESEPGFDRASFLAQCRVWDLSVPGHGHIHWDDGARDYVRPQSTKVGEVRSWHGKKDSGWPKF